MPKQELLVKSKWRDYRVVFNETTGWVTALKKDNTLFVIDAKVWEYHASGVLQPLRACDIVILPINEDRKSLATVQELYDRIMSRSPKKNLSLISIGGGIVQDITGFVASTLYRGLNWILVPTTLLSQADSCIGGKTSLNYHQYKNLLGTFYPPSEVLVYPAFVKTLDVGDFYSGLGEVVKMHMIGGESYTCSLEKELPLLIQRQDNALVNAVYQSLLLKRQYIEADEFDTGRRNMLNFGHCFGHALESASGFAIPHGQAVVAGMILANYVAGQRGLLSREQEQYFFDKLLRPVLTTQSRKNLAVNPDVVIDGMKHDKKRTGVGLALVMVKNNYEMLQVNDVTEQEAKSALAMLSQS